MGSTRLAAFASPRAGLGSSLADGLRPAIIRQPTAQRAQATFRVVMGRYLTNGDISRDRTYRPSIAIASGNRKSNEPPSGLNPRVEERRSASLFPPSRASGLQRLRVPAARAGKSPPPCPNHPTGITCSPDNRLRHAADHRQTANTIAPRPLFR